MYMDEKYYDSDKIDEVMLPGFRFHPTDEELVGFYLKRKIQQRPLPIELIKQLDIYKYDPWDLPKLATSGEKEWYFYCPRDRKYRNSARPNRVTSAGFWKATGTDRPIYSSEGTKCIGLKKSLVFYRGRAAKGIKTDWMMHEFRLPSISNSTATKRPIDKNQPPNDSWAICRIFKKTNSIMQKALSQSWVSSFPETTGSEFPTNCAKLSSENICCATQTGSAIQFCNSSEPQQSCTTSFFTLDTPSSYKSNNPTILKPNLLLPIQNADNPAGFMFSSLEMSGPTKCPDDVASMLLNVSPFLLGDQTACKINQSVNFTGMEQQSYIGSSINLPQEIQGSLGMGEHTCLQKNQHIPNVNNLLEEARSFEFPFTLPGNPPEAWKHSFSWDSPPCSSELSTCYCTNKSYA